MDHHFCQKAAQSIRPLLWQHWKRGQVFRQIAQGLRKQNAIDVTDSDSWNVNGCGCLRIKLPKPGCPRENVFPRRVRSKAALGESVPPELGNVLSIGRKEAVAGDTQVLSARHIDRVWGAEPKMEFDPLQFFDAREIASELGRQISENLNGETDWKLRPKANHCLSNW